MNFKESQASSFLQIMLASSAVIELSTVCSIFRNSLIIISVDKEFDYRKDS